METTNTRKEIVLDGKTITIYHETTTKHNQKEIGLLEDILLKSISNIKPEDVELTKLVAIVRTIYKKCDEYYLGIAIEKEDETYTLSYTNKQILGYCHKISDKNSLEKYKFSYTPNGTVKYDYEKEKQDPKSLSTLSKTLKEEINLVKKLENIPAMRLSQAGFSISRAYKSFYGKDIDFAADKTHKEVEGMMSILNYFNCPVGLDFDERNERRITDELNNSIPFGKTPTDVTKYSKNRIFRPISIIGQTLREQHLADIDSIDIILSVLGEIETSQNGIDLEYLEERFECEYPKQSVQTAYRVTKQLKRDIFDFKYRY